jgi:hypothetical protein
MTGRATRPTLIVGMVVLVAVVAGVVMAPGTAAAKKDQPGKGKPPKSGAFTIYTSEYQVYMWVVEGTFIATGAIEASGSAIENVSAPQTMVFLQADRGAMHVSVTGDTFEIVYADGKYERFVGATGSHSAEFVGWDYGVWPAVYRTFEGTLPE